MSEMKLEICARREHACGKVHMRPNEDRGRRSQRRMACLVASCGNRKAGCYERTAIADVGPTG